MKKAFRQIIRLIAGYFDKIISKEAERVFEFNSLLLGGKSGILYSITQKRRQVK